MGGSRNFHMGRPVKLRAKQILGKLTGLVYVGQNFVWVGQARVWLGHGLPGLEARTASAADGRAVGRSADTPRRASRVTTPC